jgi:hypothetical protein
MAEAGRVPKGVSLYQSQSRTAPVYPRAGSDADKIKGKSRLFLCV